MPLMTVSDYFRYALKQIQENLDQQFILIFSYEKINTSNGFHPFIFQLSDHDETNNMTKSMSIRFYVHLQANLAKQVRECQEAIKVYMIYLLFVGM